ncbi:unnamed protein product [Meganyctiphanes norvegica]|uniref:Uncharacterized protein n=1 Tax=Meganyctiphanes norvegica TaxID=48144 RepID=A0AAV2SL00_MEGNR
MTHSKQLQETEERGNIHRIHQWKYHQPQDSSKSNGRCAVVQYLHKWCYKTDNVTLAVHIVIFNKNRQLYLCVGGVTDARSRQRRRRRQAAPATPAEEVAINPGAEISFFNHGDELYPYISAELPIHTPLFSGGPVCRGRVSGRRVRSGVSDGTTAARRRSCGAAAVLRCCCDVQSFPRAPRISWAELPKGAARHLPAEEWLAGQSVVTKEEDKDGPTKDLNFYKQKAVSLFANGDYQGCVNACSEALKLNPSAAALYSNRAAANLALNNLHHAISDTSKALELLVPATEENTKSRLLCHVRRGTAFVRMQLYSQGLSEYEAARKLSPEDETLAADIKKIQALALTTTDTDETHTDDSDDDNINAS